MKILFLSSWFPHPTDNGSKIRVHYLLKALAARHQVSLLSLAFDTARPEEAGDLQRWCTSVEAIPLNPYKRERSGTLQRFLSAGPIANRPFPEVKAAARRILAERDFDLVIASTEGMACYALLATARVRRVLEEHNSASGWMWDRYREQTAPIGRLRCWLSWQKTRLYEARLLPRFDLCCMVSERDCQSTRRMVPGYRGRVELVPNGVDCERNQPGLAEVVPHTLVFNGSLTYDANYDAMRYFLAEVYPLIREQVPGVTLTITGSLAGVDLGGLQLDPTVRLTGQVPDVRPHVAGSAVCVVPIRHGSGTRLKILEAMALGVPVVATMKGVEGIDAVPGTHLMVADEPGLFARHVLRLFRSAELRDALVAESRRLVEERYSWGLIGERFTRLCEVVVDGENAKL